MRVDADNGGVVDDAVLVSDLGEELVGIIKD